MVDYLQQVFEQRLVEVLEQARFEELGPEDAARILRSVEVALESPQVAQGARELTLLLSDESAEQLDAPAADGGSASFAE
jgi:hypothetical protein